MKLNKYLNTMPYTHRKTDTHTHMHKHIHTHTLPYQQTKSLVPKRHSLEESLLFYFTTSVRRLLKMTLCNKIINASVISSRGSSFHDYIGHLWVLLLLWQSS